MKPKKMVCRWTDSVLKAIEKIEWWCEIGFLASFWTARDDKILTPRSL